MYKLIAVNVPSKYQREQWKYLRAAPVQMFRRENMSLEVVPKPMRKPMYHLSNLRCSPSIYTSSYKKQERKKAKTEEPTKKKLPSSKGQFY